MAKTWLKKRKQGFKSNKNSQTNSQFLQLPEELLTETLRYLLKSSKPLQGAGSSRIKAQKEDTALTDTNIQLSGQILAVCQILFEHGRCILYEENTLLVHWTTIDPYRLRYSGRCGHAQMQAQVDRYQTMRGKMGEPWRHIRWIVVDDTELGYGCYCSVLDDMIVSPRDQYVHAFRDDEQLSLTWATTKYGREVLSQIGNLIAKFARVTIYIDTSQKWTSMLCYLIRGFLLEKEVHIVFSRNVLNDKSTIALQIMALSDWLRCRRVTFADLQELESISNQSFEKQINSIQVNKPAAQIGNSANRAEPANS